MVSCIGEKRPSRVFVGRQLVCLSNLVSSARLDHNTGKHAPEGEVITIALIIEAFFQGHEELGYAFVSQFL
jgi:hypothetical protein